MLGVTGSIAAVRTVELARELLRHGARVVPVMTREAQRIIHPNALEFATGTKPILELTGAVEHVALMGAGPGHAHLLLIAPCTANTMSKLALGIDDSPVTTFFSTGALKVPTLVAPAMHETMSEHPFLRENQEKLRKAGVHFVDPVMEEGKAKLAEPATIVEHAIRALGSNPLRGKRVLVINGATREPIDDMRVISNKSSGRMGMAIAREAWRAGAEVEMWYAHGEVAPLDLVPTRRFETVEELVRLAPEAKRFDAVLVPAALGDYAPHKAKGKLPSEAGETTLHMRAVPKALDELRKHFPGALVPFKAESGIHEAELIDRARTSLHKRGAPFVIANMLDDVGRDNARVLFVDATRAAPVEGTKDEVARAIIARLARETK